MNTKYQDPKIISSLVSLINNQAATLDNTNIMEVCGTHTMAIAKFGVKDLLPQNIHLVSGPGCPVCVTPNTSIDKMIALSKNADVIITTFGDMVRVPGSNSTLLISQAEGADIRIVYSPIESIKIAKQNPSKKIVFLAVGFETTTPLTASLIKQAKENNINNLFVFCAHKTMPTAIEAIVNDNDINIDCMLLPGHVSTIIGTGAYNFLAQKYNTPGVVAGFEAAEILLAIYECLKNLNELKNGKQAKILNAYIRGCRDEGNPVARNLIKQVFDETTSEWRGLGTIENSGLKIKHEYEHLDAEINIAISTCITKNNPGCKCGDILRGKISPHQCPLFAKVCTPENPIGPCMVSTEGSCSAEYRFYR